MGREDSGSQAGERVGGAAAVPAQAPPVVPDAGWERVTPLRIEGGRGSFVSGGPEGDRLRVAYFRRTTDRHLVGRAWFGPGSEGPPGHAHGGAMAAVLDEAMGAVAWLEGHIVVAAHLETDFVRMLPLATDARMEAWVERVEGRKVYTRGRLLAAAAGGEYARGTALFLELSAERFAPLLARVAGSMGVTPEELEREMRRRGFAGRGG